VKSGRLAKPKTVVIAGQEYTFRADHFLDFDEFGNIKNGFLDPDKSMPVVIAGQTYSFWGVAFKDGRVAEGGLLKDTDVVVGGTVYSVKGRATYSILNLILMELWKVQR